MQLFPIPVTNLFFRDSRRDDTPAFAPVMAFIRAILELRTHAESTEDIIAARHQGQAWCDSTERELNNDMW
jgi:hypothetical protein